MKTGIAPAVVLRNRDFRRLWVSAQASNLGSLIQAVGAGWLMTSLTSSERMVALVQTSLTLPIMVFALAAGVFADSFDRRKVMIVAQSFMLVVSVLLTVLAALGGLSPWGLLGFTFLIGCGAALHNPSWQASVGDIVKREEVPTAISLNAIGFNIVRSVGPAAGGVVVAIGGAAAAFAVNAFSYLAILGALFTWHPVRTPRALPREAFGAAFVAGLRYVALSPNLIRAILRSATFGAAAVAIQALLPVVVRDELDGGAVAYGVSLGSFGIGAVSGAMFSQRLRARFANETLARICFVGMGAATCVVGNSTMLPVTALALFVGGGCWLQMMSLANATVQMSAPRWVVGRTVALYQTGAFGGMALGSWVWGLLAEAQGVTVALTAAALMLLVGAALGRFVPLPDFEGLDLDPLNHFKEPPLRLDLTHRSGPIMIVVTYEIAEADEATFQQLMAQRRRIRIRDGAQRWALLRDLEMPDLWLETYHVPTWTEYVRHHARRTQSDKGVNEAILALHKGTAPPAVHRYLERPSL